MNIIPSPAPVRSCAPQRAALLLAAAGLLTSGSPAAPTDGPPPGNWTVSLNEDFDGTVLNTALWTAGPRRAGVINSELQACVPENVSVPHGLRTLKVEKREAHDTGMGGYVIDGIPVLKRGNPHSVSVVPEHLFLKCAVSDNDWTGTQVPPAGIDAGLPCTMDIDYVRGWTREPAH